MNEASWKKAKDVLFDATRLPPEERAAYVRRHFEDQPDVCAEVLDILRDADTPDDLLSRPAFRIDSGDVDELADLTPSTEIAQYTILNRLRRGGMGQVFLAHDEQLQRPVALKCLLSRSSAEADRHRILAEARAAAAITHTNVARVYDVVEHRGRAFMVMEYVAGESLFDRMARGRLPMPSVVDIGLDLLKALGAAQLGNIVHGDLKPGNVQLTPDGSAKVLDFGVARVVRGAAGSGSTTVGGVRSVGPLPTLAGGTPGYMSPEQLRGERIDGRSDVYSLGVVLFEMATGRRLHREETVEGRLEAANRLVPRADSIVAAVPQRLADVIAMALEPRVEARYQSAREMEQALTPVKDLLKARSRRELILRWLARVAVGVPLVLLGLELVGLMTTAGFNRTFGRIGPYARFSDLSWSSSLRYGGTSVFASLFIATLVAVVTAAVRFVFGAVQSIGPVSRVAQRAKAKVIDFGVRMGLHRPKGLAQALAGLALATLLIFTQVYRDVISAWGASFDESPIAVLLPIGENEYVRNRYNQFLDIAIPVFLYGLYRVIRLRRREATRDGAAALSVLVGVITIMVLMREWPQRTLNHRNLERWDFAGERCYENGESGEEVLLLCPASEPPRNHVVRRDDPRVRRLGTVENIFRGVTAGSSKP